MGSSVFQSSAGGLTFATCGKRATKKSGIAAATVGSPSQVRLDLHFHERLMSSRILRQPPLA